MIPNSECSPLGLYIKKGKNGQLAITSWAELRKRRKKWLCWKLGTKIRIYNIMSELKGGNLLEKEQYTKPNHTLTKKLILASCSIQAYGKRNLRSWAYIGSKSWFIVGLWKKTGREKPSKGFICASFYSISYTTFSLGTHLPQRALHINKFTQCLLNWRFNK